MKINYTLAQIDLLLLGAMRLRFHDDVAYWKAERERLVAEQRAAR